MVDDHSINREFLRSALALENFEVDEAASGQDAVDRCRQAEYDLILMDLHMPGQGGIETAAAIRALDSSSARASVIFLTADARSEVHDQLKRAGFDYVLNKPLSVDGLISRLGDWQLLKTDAPRRVASSDPSLLIDGRAALATCNGQSGLVNRMQRMFAEELGQRLGELDQHMLRGDRSSAAAILHQWTGAAAYAGASKLSKRIDSLRTTLVDTVRSRKSDALLAEAYLDFLRCARATRAALLRGERGQP